MRSGVLYIEPNCALAKLKGVFVGSEKRVYRNDGSMVLKTVIRESDAPNIKRADVRSRAYVMLDAKEREIAVARPNYAEGDDPTIVGWPICRMPRVDHAAVDIQGKQYILTILNQNFVPIVDGRNTLCGILTRRGVIAYLAETE